MFRSFLTLKAKRVILRNMIDELSRPPHKTGGFLLIAIKEEGH